MERPQLRDSLEIQRAHDVLHAVAVSDVDLHLPAEWLDRVRACHDVLSWVLNGPCSEAFYDNLRMLEELAALRGYKLEHIQ